MQGILVDTLPMPYRDEIKGLSTASGLNLGKLVYCVFPDCKIFVSFCRLCEFISLFIKFI